MNIYIKKGVSVLYNRKNGDIHFSISTSGVHKIYSITDEYHVFLELIQIEHDVDEIQTLNRRGFFNIKTFEIEWEEIDGVDKCSTCRRECK